MQRLRFAGFKKYFFILSPDREAIIRYALSGRAALLRFHKKGPVEIDSRFLYRAIHPALEPEEPVSCQNGLDPRRQTRRRTLGLSNRPAYSTFSLGV